MCAQRAAYPAEREVDVVLRDGSTLRVRPIRPEDEDPMVAFLDGLSERSRAFRFFSPAVDTRRAAQWAVDVDYGDAYGLVATRGEVAPFCVGIFSCARGPSVGLVRRGRSVGRGRCGGRLASRSSASAMARSSCGSAPRA